MIKFLGVFIGLAFAVSGNFIGAVAIIVGAFAIDYIIKEML